MHKHTVITLGSHSALQILKGAKDEGFRTLIINTPDREDFYNQYNFIDDIVTIKSFSEFPRIEKQLIAKNAVIVPHGSFVAYLGYQANKDMKVKYFGNKDLLDWEADRKKQLMWMEKAGINVPRVFKKGDKIDRQVIVKSFGADGGAGYFVARNQQDFDTKLTRFKKDKFIVQEYVIGVTMYIHYFYSPLTETLEIMSIDRRYESNVDSLGRLPFHYQQGLIPDPTFVVVGNQPMTLRESLLPKAYNMGQQVIKASKKLIGPKGLYGPFCLETILTDQQEFYIVEISCRIVAGTNLFIQGSPYTWLNYDVPMSTGRRIALELRRALIANKLNQLVE